MSKQPHEIARTLIEDLFGKGQLELIPQLCADDVVIHDPIMGDLDRKGLEQQVQMYRRAFPDLKMEVIDQVSSGDKVSTVWRATGTQKGEFMGAPATNKKGIVEGITMERFVGGKLKESRAQWDVLGLLRQLGIAPQMGAAVPGDGGAKRPGATPSQPRR